MLISKPPAVCLSRCDGCHLYVLWILLWTKTRVAHESSREYNTHFALLGVSNDLPLPVDSDNCAVLSGLTSLSAFVTARYVLLSRGAEQRLLCLIFFGRIFSPRLLCVRVSVSCRVTYRFNMTEHSLSQFSLTARSCGCLEKRHDAFKILEPWTGKKKYFSTERSCWWRPFTDFAAAPLTSTLINRHPHVNFDVAVSQKKKNTEQIALPEISDLLQN